MSPSARPVTLALSVLSLSGCAASTTGAGAEETLSALRPHYVSTYLRRSGAPVLIRNATILTAAGPELRGSSILFADGKIVAVGSQVTAPPGATIVDGTGKYVTPGIIDAHSHLGVYSAPSTPSLSDGNEATDPVTAEVWAEHSFWPQDPQIPLAIAGGVTVIQALPGSANLIGGRAATLRLVPARTVQEMKYPGAPHGVKMACGENPKRVYGGKTGPSTRMGNLAGDRAAMAEAEKYRREWDKWLENKNGDPPERDLKLETLADVLRGKALVQNHCYRADEMAQMLDLAREFGFRIRAFHHAVESYKIADVLARDSVASAVWADWWGFKMESFDGIPENAALLEQAGARAIIHSDSEEGIQRLNQEAAKAMYAGRRAGIEVGREHAVRWITINPAWALGIDSTTGSLVKGKAADVVLWSGDPFSVYSRAEKVYNEGWLVFDRSDPRQQLRTDFNLGTAPPGLGGGPAEGRIVRRTGGQADRRTVSSPASVVTSARPAQAQTFVITGGTIYPVSGPRIENGTIVLRDGKIAAVGADVAVPEGAIRIDAKGRSITPGLIHGGSTLGLKLFEVGAQEETQEDTAAGDIKPSFNVAEAVDPASIAIPVARLEGVTSAIAKPAIGLIPGQAVLIDLAGERMEDVVAQSPVAMFADLSEGSKTAGGGSRARAVQRLRRVLRDALEYEKRRGDFRRAQMQPLAASAEDLEALLPVLRGKLPLFVIANRRSDIENAVRVGREFGLRLVIWGGVEAWQLAGELARARVPVILEPLTNVPRFDALAARLDNATLLWKAGVRVAVAQQDAAHFRDLRQAAGNEVQNGMSWDEALRSVTLSTAEAAQVADRYGSLEPGKVANVVVWSGDPFEFSSSAERVFIRGREMPRVSRQTELLERYRTLPPRW